MFTCIIFVLGLMGHTWSNRKGVHIWDTFDWKFTNKMERWEELEEHKFRREELLINKFIYENLKEIIK